ncbi:MAG: 3-hydroxyacyl-CoA dehydrogenase [Anaerolineae bacterium]|nr:3-hydroxyacyl-CoA dehydrogenase [Anaerolineae bacterium]
MRILRAAVVGAGAMGGGIAQVIASAGIPVWVKDIDPGQLDAARLHVRGIYQRHLDRGRITASEMQGKLGLIEYTLSYEGFESVDIAIEAVPEVMSIKRVVLAELNEVCHPGAVFASNTSALSITEMGAASGRPHKMIGLHFFNPAHVMKLVEIIPCAETDQDTVHTVERFSRELGKIPVIVRECPGFLVNRLLMPYLGEAVRCLQEGASRVDEIDAAMGRAGFGWPMGPFALMDMLGLDVCHHIMAYLGEQYGQRMEEPALMHTLLDAGRRGEKNGRGFYDYPGRKPSPEVDDLLLALRQGGGSGDLCSTFSADRLMARLLNEAFLCVEEGVASVQDVDLACIAGLGMQIKTGADLRGIGPLEYADDIGLDAILDTLQGLEAQFGCRFRPAAILEQKVKAGEWGKVSGVGFLERRV